MKPSIRHHLAQALSAVENRSGNWRQVLAESYGSPRELFIIGITGPPGAGKSTLIDALAAHWAANGLTVGVLAIDPSSPFSGGAILGDRLRMRQSEDLDNVFIRSMSARGHGGGLNASALDLCMVMAHHGCSHVLLEAVGSGQSEVDIGFVADCTLVVAVPGLGDSVQAAKAGLMEIGDLYVVNKSDLPQARSVQQDLAAMLAVSFHGRPGPNDPRTAKGVPARAVGAMPQALSERYGGPEGAQAYWHPPVLAAAVERPDLIAGIAQTIDSFAHWLKATDRFHKRRARALANHVLDIARNRLFSEWTRNFEQSLGKPLEEWTCAQLADGVKDPYRLADMMMDGSSL
ncbi:methylmalonyl Co-A mutase-associated GTPase MeaB [Taklimakanibacter deserti]|uniref:methylmalonyl Co-A mutase-associated GTPase MeaB n=1 Tax=Taklimakanibacter deserti TaxID=2267839 RepID=UPI0013C5120B